MSKADEKTVPATLEYQVPKLSPTAEGTWAHFFAEVIRLADRARDHESQTTGSHLVRTAATDYARDSRRRKPVLRGTLVGRESATTCRTVHPMHHADKESTS